MDGMMDENYTEADCYQFRSSIDRRFWHTSGGWLDAIGFGVVDDYGNMVRTYERPLSAVKRG